MTVQVQLINSGGQATFDGLITPSPLYLLGPFTITATTPGLTTGVPLTILQAGAVIYDVGIFVTTGWNGTTPVMDVGTFDGQVGLFATLAGTAVELGDPVAIVNDNAPILSNQDSASWLAAAIASVGAAAGAAFNPPPLYASDVSPIAAVVSQNGQQGGTATGATTGVANVYLLVATPYTA